jgi:peptidoglycan/LPS O-acetylase OafA/YrhL
LLGGIGITVRERIVFANQLRGVAAFSVACSHLIGVFWLMRPVVSDATFTPVLEGPNSSLVGLVNHAGFNCGVFGVAVFFLISGLVIPISLDRHTPASFLAARVLRIYPTYVAALLVEIALLRANALYWGKPFGYSAWAIVSNCLLIHDLVGQPYIDLVNWTLCVEVRFYLVMALIAGAVRRGSVGALVGVALATLGINLAIHAGALGATPLSNACSTESLFVVFMLIGVLFNYHLRGRLGTVALIASIGVMGALFVACWHASILGPQFSVLARNYAYALALFATLYALRRRVPDSRLLDAMAAISFPFYLVHSLIGYSALKWFMLVLGWGYPEALAGALVVAVLVATALHKTVEAPTIRMGKKLTLRSPDSLLMGRSADATGR